MRRRWARLVLGIVACACLAGAVRRARAEQEGAGTRERWRALAGEAAQRLKVLAEWCGAKKLFGSRSEVHEAILHLAPDDAAVRKAQKYAKGRDGRWTRDPKWQPPKNLAVGVEEYRTLRAEHDVWFLDRAEELRDEAEDPRLRAEIVARALGATPSSERARGWNDEVRDDRVASGVRWILLETRNARTRRPMLRKAAQDAVAAAKPARAGTPEEADGRGGIEWPVVLQGEHARLLGFPGRDELARTAARVDAAFPLFRAAFDRDMDDFQDGARYGAGMSIYVFDDASRTDAFNAAQPGVTAREVEFWRPLVYWWLPNRAAAVVKSGHPETRLEAAPRLVIGELVRRGFGLGKERAWLAEGLVVYLTWPVTGTRLLFTVNDVDSRYAEGKPGIPTYEQRMTDPQASWLELGREMIEGPDRPDVLLLPGKDFNRITKRDVLYSYCIAAWAVEGLAGKADAFFRAVAGPDGNDLDRVCLEVLGYDARALEERVHRWLRETADLPER